MKTFSLPDVSSSEERLVSLDALRGFAVLLFLTVGIVGQFARGPMKLLVEANSEGSAAFWTKLTDLFQYAPWEGFTLCDLVTPLFVFIAGAAIPFSLSKRLKSEEWRMSRLWIRIFRRVVVLWVLGIALSWLYPSRSQNALQIIAVAYLFGCLAYLFLPKNAQWGLFVGLLVLYWAGMKIKGGGYSEEMNVTLGYKLLSSLTIIATALCGVLAGDLLYTTREEIEETSGNDVGARKLAQRQACLKLVIFGLAFFLLGLLWSLLPEKFFFYCPIVRRLWTSSMGLYASGISLLLLALFYAVFDVWKTPGLKTFLVVLGTNALAAYALSYLLNFEKAIAWLRIGLEEAGFGDYFNEWNQFVVHLLCVALILIILWNLWRREKFLRA
jgi:predicted acyltransferase